LIETGFKKRRGMPDRKHHQAIHALRVKRAQRPGNHRAPVMPNDVRALNAEVIEDPPDIVEDWGEHVGVGFRRLVGTAKTAEIRGQDTQSRGREGWDLMAPEAR